jgi:hypothetical protein
MGKMRYKKFLEIIKKNLKISKSLLINILSFFLYLKKIFFSAWKKFFFKDC